MKTPAPRSLAYLALWGLLFAVVCWRRVPPGDVQLLPAVDAPPPFQLDLNQAPWERLTLIDGIGETLAKRIVAAREARGGFDSVDDVMALPGVPDRPFREGQAWVVVLPRAPLPTD